MSAATAPDNVRDADPHVASSVVWRDRPLEWRDVAAVADGAQLRVTESARLRIDAARAIVDTPGSARFATRRWIAPNSAGSRATCS
jgi:hypothetical protein